MLSVRNQFRGQIISVKTGSVMSEIILDIGGGREVVAMISASSARRLKLKKGKEATAFVKATEVMIATDDKES